MECFATANTKVLVFFLFLFLIVLVLIKVNVFIIELCQHVSTVDRVIITFTDHWNTLKSILLWPELHPFERLGLVLDYLGSTNGITSLHTETIQGLLRPEGDKYANKKLYADPIFAVYGTVI